METGVNTVTDQASTADKGAKKTRAEKRRPDLDTMYTINADGSRNFVQIADVKGRWQRVKKLVFAALIVIYAAIPWIPVGGNPAVLIDIPQRHAYLFGGTFTNQDFYLVFFIISGVGFSLFVLTALFGRVWCGFACPQTVFLEGVYRRVERWLEGTREARIRRNQGPLNFDKAWRKGLKHVLFLGLSFVIAHIFLSYFIPVEKLRAVITGNPADHWTAFFWSMFWTAVLYFNYSWFREQTCLIICPYGRLQSTLTDEDTILIGYDEVRGEPRSPGGRAGGDCIDCYRCVAVCPTGIDIRNGVQMECIGCSNCIDACNTIMERVGKPHGLIRYDSVRGFEKGGARRSFFRPRVFVYAFLMLLGASVFALSAAGRTSLDVKVLRQKGLPFAIEEGKIRNLYTLNLQNKTDRHRVFFLTPVISDDAASLDPEFIIPTKRIELDGLATRQVPVFAFIPREKWLEPFDLGVAIADSADGERQVVDLLFRGP